MSEPVTFKFSQTTFGIAKALATADAKLSAMLGVGTFLTAEEMFAFAKAQLQKTDGEIGGHVKSITLAKEKAAALQSISAGLRQVKNASLAEQKAKLDELITQAYQSGSPEVANKLSTARALIEKNGVAATSDYFEGLAQDVDASVTGLTSSTELTMIKIQGLMQHRSQILQLASNVIAALNEPAKNAIGNLRGS